MVVMNTLELKSVYGMRKWHDDTRRTNARQNHMNGSTLSSFTVGPWRIMALRPWINMLWAAVMLLNPMSHVLSFRKQSLHGLKIEHIREIAGRHIYLEVLVNVSHKDTGTYLWGDIVPLWSGYICCQSMGSPVTVEMNDKFEAILSTFSRRPGYTGLSFVSKSRIQNLK